MIHVSDVRWHYTIRPDPEKGWSKLICDALDRLAKYTTPNTTIIPIATSFKYVSHLFDICFDMITGHHIIITAYRCRNAVILMLKMLRKVAMAMTPTAHYNKVAKAHHPTDDIFILQINQTIREYHVGGSVSR